MRRASYLLVLLLVVVFPARIECSTISLIESPHFFPRQNISKPSDNQLQLWGRAAESSCVGKLRAVAIRRSSSRPVFCHSIKFCTDCPDHYLGGDRYHEIITARSIFNSYNGATSVKTIKNIFHKLQIYFVYCKYISSCLGFDKAPTYIFCRV